MFYFERVLERISKSKYKNQIILKGGLLLTSIIGNDNRTTRDMDATLKGIPLALKNVEKMFNEILCIDVNDGVTFEIISIKDIRLEDEYGGYRLNILSKLDNNKTYITIELTTGDVVTPREIMYTYNCIFDNKKIPIMAYTIETILAEKLHTIISRGLLNTRLKDFYDVFILVNTKNNEIDNKILKKAVKTTFEKRESIYDLEEFKVIVEELELDRNMNKLWHEYQAKNTYANNIEYKEIINALKQLLEILN